MGNFCSYCSRQVQQGKKLVKFYRVLTDKHFCIPVECWRDGRHRCEDRTGPREELDKEAIPSYKPERG